MQFGVLGPLAVWTDDGESVRVPGVKVRALLADLLLSPGRLVSADRLIDDLWGESPPANPSGALQSKVSQLRRALEEAEPGTRHLVRYRAPSYRLDVEAEAVDADRFEQLLQHARALLQDKPREAEAVLGQALSLWRGPALVEFADESFARSAVAQLEEARLAAIEDRMETRLALGEHTTLIGELDGLVEEHPLRERLRGLHMTALYQAGRQADALDSHRQLRERLNQELGLDPAPEISELHRSILNQDPTLDAPARGMRAGRPRTNIPAPRTTLVGRDPALERVRDLLRSHRLLTLTGAGGVGKTRLALAAARTLVDDHPDGVWLVELTAPGDEQSGDSSALVAERVAEALDLPDSTAHLGHADAGPSARPGVIDRLAAALESQRMLLVLDNCEHVAKSVAELVRVLLDSAADLRVIATSRRPLGLTGEQLWSVPPLAVPDHEFDSAALSRLARFHGIELFIERAAAADPDFELASHNAEAVVDICRRLDGLPLALELAAARTRTLSVHDLADRLDDRFRLLASKASDIPQRQQTLRALVDWSWELLTPPELAVLRRLSAFSGAPTLPAVEAVCGDVAGSELLEVLANLVDHSLVVVDKQEGSARYRLLETIRSYGRERLGEAGEREEIMQRHAVYYTQLAEQGDRQLRGPNQRTWLARFDAERPDLRAAVEWAVRHDRELALRLVGALSWYWYLRGRQREACRLLDRALRAEGNAPAVAHANSMAWLSALGFLEGSIDDPASYGGQALDLYRHANDVSGAAHAKLLIGGLLRPWGPVPHGDQLVSEALDTFCELDQPWPTAGALTVRGWLALARGELDAARRDGDEAHALFREVEDRWGQVRSAELLAQVAEIRGDYERARQLHRGALDAAETLGLWAVVAQELSRLGRLAALRTNYEEARDLHEQALQLTRDLALEQGTVFARLGLGLIARRQGRLDDAEAHFRAILPWHRERGFHAGTAFCLAELGFVAELRGDEEHARRLHLDGVDAAHRSGDKRAVALALEGLAGAAASSQPEQAATLLGAAAALRAVAGGPLPAAERGDVDRIASTAAGQLSPEVYDTAFTGGQALSPEEAAQLAETGAGSPP